jgi:hypothetical protein
METTFAKHEGCFAEPIAKSLSKWLKKLNADVAKLVDARDLKSPARSVFIQLSLQTSLADAKENDGTKRDLQNILRLVLGSPHTR